MLILRTLLLIAFGLHVTLCIELTQPFLAEKGFNLLATIGVIVHDIDQLLLLSRINGDAPRANDGGGV
jgi:uncharacterized protein YhhL (DUF1145 family)